MAAASLCAAVPAQVCDAGGVVPDQKAQKSVLQTTELINV